MCLDEPIKACWELPSSRFPPSPHIAQVIIVSYSTMAINAVCVFMTALTGTIFLQQQDPTKSVTKVSGEISGLDPGLHGFHIHVYGDVRTACMNASTHYNPFNKEHGAPEDDNRHVGDLGNINVDENKIGKINHDFQLVELHGEHSVLGRAIVVHKLQDDLGRGGNEESKKTGNAGARVDCCVIGLTKSD